MGRLSRSPIEEIERALLSGAVAGFDGNVRIRIYLPPGATEVVRFDIYRSVTVHPQQETLRGGS